MTDRESIRKKIEHIVQRRLNLLNGDVFDLLLETKGFTYEIVDTIIDSLSEEPISDDLEKEIEESWKHLDLSFIGGGYEMFKVRNIVSDIAYHFAYWKKQQMMKDAIDTQVVLGPNDNHVLMNGLFNNYKYHDKVKLIIIKED